MTKRILLLLLAAALCASLIAACGINPEKVTEKYALREAEKYLASEYGIDFAFDETEFDETDHSLRGFAHPKDDPSVRFEIRGSVGFDHLISIDGNGAGRFSTYNIFDGFQEAIIAQAHKELEGKYDLEIGGGADLAQVARNVREYFSDYPVQLKKHVRYDLAWKWFDHNTYYSLNVPLTLNGEKIFESHYDRLALNKNNGKVLADYSSVEMELEQYLRLLAEGKLEDYIDGMEAFRSWYYGGNPFPASLWDRIYSELEKGDFDFELGGNADFARMAANLQECLDIIAASVKDYADYDHSEYFKREFSEGYKAIGIDFTLNGEKISKTITTDNRNGKVVIDRSITEFAWQGVLELEEYLRLLADGKLEERIDEIYSEHPAKQD